MTIQLWSTNGLGIWLLHSSSQWLRLCQHWSSPQTFGQVEAGVWQYLVIETHSSWSFLGAWCLCQLMGDTCWHWISILHWHEEQNWVIINALLLAGNQNYFSLLCLNYHAACSSFFSNSLLLRWGLAGIPRHRMCLQNSSAPKSSQQLHIPTTTGWESKENHFTSILQAQNPDAAELEEPQREWGDAEVTQGEDFSSLLLCLKEQWLQIDAQQDRACSLVWHNTSCLALCLTSWVYHWFILQNLSWNFSVS